MNENMTKIIELIKRSYNIAIIMHNNPDGDCIGSFVALEEALKNINKNVDVIIHSKISKKFSFIVGNHRTNKKIIPFIQDKYDIVFMLDVADYDRTFEDVYDIYEKLIVIDHHPDAKVKGDIYLNTNEVAAAINVYEIIKELTKITPKIATAIYLGIYSDTTGFKNPNMNDKAHDVCAELIHYNADIVSVHKVMEEKSLSYINLLSIAYKNLKIDEKYGIASVSISRSDIECSKSTYEEASIIIDGLKWIKSCDIIFTFIEGKNDVWVQCRSQKTNILPILKSFNGGGHEKASGCVIKNSSIYNAKYNMLEFTKHYLDNLQ